MGDMLLDLCAWNLGNFNRHWFRTKLFAYPESNRFAYTGTGIHSHSKPYCISDAIRPYKDHRESNTYSNSDCYSNAHALRRRESHTNAKPKSAYLS
jgi:hypothetical protein